MWSYDSGVTIFQQQKDVEEQREAACTMSFLRFTMKVEDVLDRVAV